MITFKICLQITALFHEKSVQKHEILKTYDFYEKMFSLLRNKVYNSG
jgi:hypothetical protein